MTAKDVLAFSEHAEDIVEREKNIVRQAVAEVIEEIEFK